MIRPGGLADRNKIETSTFVSMAICFTLQPHL
jgi:hypothetical protein